MQGGLDVMILDYFKSTSDLDAFGTYNEMGRLTDFVKNTIAGTMQIAAIGAAQAYGHRKGRGLCKNRKKCQYNLSDTG
jgi:hypothetical protein